MDRDIVAKLEAAFERARYGGEGDYNPDGDLFEAAATEIEALRKRVEEGEALLRYALNEMTAWRRNLPYNGDDLIRKLDKRLNRK